jgi:hypothetical protein
MLRGECESEVNARAFVDGGRRGAAAHHSDERMGDGRGLEKVGVCEWLMRWVKAEM